MSTILFILSIIGRILLVILCIILVLLALILLVPVRYRVDFSGEKGLVDADVGVSWLLKFLMADARVHKTFGDGAKDAQGAETAGDAKTAPGAKTADQAETVKIDIRICGISPAVLRRKRAEKQIAKLKAQKKKQLDTIKVKDPERYQQMKEEARLKKEARAQEKARLAAEEAARKEQEKAEIAAQKEAIRAAKDREEKRRLRAIQRMGYALRAKRAIISTARRIAEIAAFLVSSLGRILWRALMLPSSIVDAVFKMVSKIQEICATISGIVGFLTDIRTQRALRVIKKRVFRLLRHIKPRQLSGDLRFGFNDPAMTGEVMAGASALYPLHAGKLRLYPSFEEPVISGDVQAAGRIFLGYVLIQALFVIASRDVRFVWRTVRHKK